MPFLYGAVGALIALALFIGGAFAGWKLNTRFHKTKPRDTTDDDRKRMEEMAAQQDAWRALQNYSAEVAYGMTTHDMKAGER